MPPKGSVRVTGVVSSFAGHRAGLQVGDQIEGVNGSPLKSPFAFPLAQLLEAHEPALFAVRRNGESLELKLPAMDWRIRSEPVQSPSAAHGWAILSAAEDRAAAEDWAGFDALAEQAAQAATSAAAAGWIHLRLAELQRRRNPERERQSLRAAIAQWERDPALTRAVLRARLDLGTDMALGQHTEEGSARLAKVCPALAAAAMAYSYARCLDSEGVAASIQGRARDARVYFHRALDAFEQALPAAESTTSDVAMVTSHLAILELRSGNLRAARGGFERALVQTLASEGAGLRQATVLNNLAVVEQHLGDFDASEQHLRTALAISRREDPGGLDEAQTLGNFGNLEARRLRYAQARDHYAAELAILRVQLPGSRHEASALFSLGRLARNFEQWEDAERFTRAAQQIDDQVAELSEDRVSVLVQLGQIARGRGQLDDALKLLQQGSEEFERLIPDSATAATARAEYAAALLEAAQPKIALGQARRAVGILQARAPGSAALARALQTRARVLHALGEREAALLDYQAAIVALEEQLKRFGSSADSLSQFRASFAPLFQEAILLLLDLGRDRDAFELSERYRAQTLLAALRQHPTLLDGQLPQAVAAKRAHLHQRIEAIHDELLQAAPDDQEALHQSLTALHDQREALLRSRPATGQERRQPAAVTDQPLEPIEARLRRENATLLSYVSGPQVLVVFELSATGLRAYRRSVSDETLADHVFALRRQVISGAGTEDLRLAQEGYALAQWLLTPKALNQRGPLYLIADGALHQLPFALLRGAPHTPESHAVAIPPSQQGGAELTALPYLIESRAPILLRAADDLRERNRLSAGDADTAEPRRQPLDRFLGLANPTTTAGPPLPFSEAEVEAIGSLFESSQLLLGTAASESSLKATPASSMPQPQILHFATHAQADHRSPLNSFLVMADPSASEAGRLRAWEVMEQLELEAELVTLSACESALGQVRGGEGMLGLTSAFQFAGAQNVLATLWSVNDELTASLMADFYRRWLAGVPRAEALRQAQLEFVGPLAGAATPVRTSTWLHDFWQRLTGAEQKTRSAPYFWAGFALYGAP